MAHPSTLARAKLARLLSAAVLPVASLLLSTCARDVTAPPAPTELAFIQQPGNVMAGHQDRKSTRLNSSHTVISYAVFCLKKKSRQKPSKDVLDEPTAREREGAAAGDEH